MAVQLTLIGGEKVTVKHDGGGSDFIDLLNDDTHPQHNGRYLYVQRDDDGKWVWVNTESIGWVQEA